MNVKWMQLLNLNGQKSTMEPGCIDLDSNGIFDSKSKYFYAQLIECRNWKSENTHRLIDWTKSWRFCG